MKIALGADHGGFALKEQLIKYLEEKGHQVLDVGTHSEESVDYPAYGAKVAEAILRQEVRLGIVVCGTGIGISIAANKVRGIRAALCTNSYMAQMAREHNDANVLALGARVIGEGLAQDIVDAFLRASFQRSRHLRRVDQISQLEQGC